MESITRTKELLAVHETVCTRQKESAIRNSALLKDVDRICRLLTGTCHQHNQLNTLKSRYQHYVASIYPQWLSQCKGQAQHGADTTPHEPTPMEHAHVFPGLSVAPAAHPTASSASACGSKFLPTSKSVATCASTLSMGLVSPTIAGSSSVSDSMYSHDPMLHIVDAHTPPFPVGLVSSAAASSDSVPNQKLLPESTLFTTSCAPTFSTPITTILTTPTISTVSTQTPIVSTFLPASISTPQSLLAMAATSASVKIDTITTYTKPIASTVTWQPDSLPVHPSLPLNDKSLPVHSSPPLSDKSLPVHSSPPLSDKSLPVFSSTLSDKSLDLSLSTYTASTVSVTKDVHLSRDELLVEMATTSFMCDTPPSTHSQPHSPPIALSRSHSPLIMLSQPHSSSSSQAHSPLLPSPPRPPPTPTRSSSLPPITPSPPHIPHTTHCPDQAKVVTNLLATLNNHLRAQGETVAMEMYSEPEDLDRMKLQISNSNVLASTIIKSAESASDCSTWDPSVVGVVLLHQLSLLTASHGSPIPDTLLTEEAPLITSPITARSSWSQVWAVLLEHISLLHDCHRPLDELAAIFTPALVQTSTEKACLQLFCLFKLAVGSGNVGEEFVELPDHQDREFLAAQREVGLLLDEELQNSVQLSDEFHEGSAVSGASSEDVSGLLDDLPSGEDQQIWSMKDGEREDTGGLLDFSALGGGDLSQHSSLLSEDSVVMGLKIKKEQEENGSSHSQATPLDGSSDDTSMATPPGYVPTVLENREPLAPSQRSNDSSLQRKLGFLDNLENELDESDNDLSSPAESDPVLEESFDF